MNYKGNHLEFGELIFAVLNGTADDNQHRLLEEHIVQDPAAMEYYLELATIYAVLRLSGNLSAFSAVPKKPFRFESDDQIWQALAENERTAVSINIEKRPKEPAVPYDTKKCKVVKLQRKVSRLSLYTAICSTAALILIMAYVFINPRKPPPEPVGILVNAIDAAWADKTNPMEKGTSLFAGTISLLSGFAEIKLEDGAELVLQAPAELNLENPSQVFLNRGKLTCHVPKRAIGFIIRTSGATVVDYGTQFGIVAHASGQTEAHVFQGRVELRTGSDPARFQQSMQIQAGQAGLVDNTGSISADLPAQPDAFVRKLPSSMAFGRPGQRLDLADIVGGGNGFGTGRLDYGIDPVSGQVINEKIYGDRKGSNQYIVLPSMPFIDGIFVPNASTEPVYITSQCHIFEQCPETSGQYWIGILNGGKIAVGYADLVVEQVKLRGIQYGTGTNPAITMHPNVGITFDLARIRSANPGTQILRFTSLFGIDDERARSVRSVRSEFWVLVDGRLRFHALHDYNMPINPYISIEISGSDRFLTLITTDYDKEIASEWCFFGNPALELSSN